MEAQKVVVVGTGYVGLVTGTCLATAGQHVVCNDISESRIAQLNRSEVPFYEPDLEQLIAEATADGSLSFTLNLESALLNADFAILAVGTPSNDDGSANLNYLKQAAAEVAKYSQKGLVLVIRSTVPPGTGDELAGQLAALGRQDIEVVNAPEFLAEGTAVRDFQKPDRLVFGGSQIAAKKVASLWSNIRPEAPRHLVSRPTAELAKYAANTFLAARVSLINEIANLCDIVGADVREVSKIVGEDVRVGANFLRAGIGYGGSCFPKDVQAISHLARSKGLQMPVAEATEVTNNSQWKKVLAKIHEELPKLPGATVAILGISFKPETDDTRYAPGLHLAHELAKLGAVVRMHDPIARLPSQLAEKGIIQAASIDDCVRGANLTVVATEWRQYGEANWKQLGAMAKKRVLIDARNAMPWIKIQGAGWKISGVGAKGTDS